MSEQDYGNLVYLTVVAGLSLGYNKLAKKFIKMKPADLGKVDFEDSLRLVGSVVLAMWTQDMLIKWGILPPNIHKTV
jgi:hypothetical protein